MTDNSRSPTLDIIMYLFPSIIMIIMKCLYSANL